MNSATELKVFSATDQFVVIFFAPFSAFNVIMYVFVCSPENDLVELVWENGQIMMQGQFSRAKRSPSFTDLPSQSPVIRDKYSGHVNTPKFVKFGGMESILDDAAPSVPSGEISLSHDDEMVPWLNYPVDDGFKQDFCSELLPEISGVTGNETSNHHNNNSFASTEKRNSGRSVGQSHIVPVHNGGVNTEFRNGSKVCSSSTGLLNPYSSLQGQICFPSLGSGVSDVVMNSSNHKVDVSYVDSNQGGLVSTKLQSKNVGSLSGNGSRLLNFSHFSRPTALIRANLQKTDGLAASCSSVVEKMVTEEKEPPSSSRIPIKSTLIEQPKNDTVKETNFHNQLNLVGSMVDSRPEMRKPLDEACTAERADAPCQEDSIKNENCASLEICASTTKGVTDGEKSAAPVVAASSVCSGNSGERTSNDQTHNSKRKHHDLDESESRSEVRHSVE